MEEGEKGWINYFSIEVTCSLLLSSDRNKLGYFDIPSVRSIEIIH